MVTVDTSALIAAIDQGDVNHSRAIAFFSGEPQPLIIPAGILSEICYFLETRLGPRWLVEFLGNIATGAFMVDFVDAEIQRIMELVRRYHDLPLGYADAAVIACAERNGGRVATFDLRHFAAVAREGTIQIVP